MRKAIYPGSFDPITRGHLDVIKRAAGLFDELVVAVATNDEKKPLFSRDEKIRLIEESCAGLENVTVDSFTGLVVDYAAEKDALALVRGLRAISDFEFEFQMALMNRQLSPTLETVFLTPKEKYSYISSRLVKEVARLGGDIQSLVPKHVAKALLEKFS